MKNLFLGLLLCLSNVLIAQNYGTIKGKVFDDLGKPLPFANVIAFQGEKPIGTTADENGKFTLKPLNPGIYEVEVSFMGFHSLLVEEVIVTADQIRFLNKLQLTPNSVFIEDGVVIETFTDPLIDPEETSKMVMRSTEIEKTPMAKDPVGLIASMSSEISQKPGTNELYFRGSRPTSVLYVVDGQRVRTGIANYPGGAIGSVSVYTGGIPAKYGDTTGGVIVVETKNYFDFYKRKLAELSE